MKFKYAFQTAVGGIKINTLRSFLTILGIIIGITAIMLVMSVGESANRLILNQVEGLGSRTFMVIPGQDAGNPTGFSALFVDSLKDRELNALKDKRNVPLLEDITPLVMVPGTITYRGTVFQPSIMGADISIASIMDIAPHEGAFFSEDDVKDKRSVAVIGHEVKEQLFGESDAIGEAIKVKGKNFWVRGVIAEKGRVGLFNVDDAVFVPYTTAKKYLLGQDHYNQFIARGASEDAVPRAVLDVEVTLRELHRISSSDDDDFHVHTQADIAARASMITGVLTILLSSIAAISLVVGGIGIMNIMLVSVTERTREIGLRKALGATNNALLTQFLLEATLLTGTGGVIGIGLGAGLSFLTSVILTRVAGLDFAFVFSLKAALLGLSVSTAVGLVFGLYPARSAARKNPIEALRYE